MEKQRQHLIRVKLDLLTGLSNAINEAEGPAKPKLISNGSLSATKQSGSRQSAFSTTMNSWQKTPDKIKTFGPSERDRMNRTLKVSSSQSFLGGTR